MPSWRNVNTFFRKAFSFSAGPVVFPDEHNGEEQPDNNQGDIEDKELPGGQGQHFHANQHGEGGEAVTHSHVQGVNSRFALVFHLRTHREPEHMTGRIIDGVVGGVFRDFKHFDNGQDRHQGHDAVGNHRNGRQQHGNGRKTAELEQARGD